MLGRQLSKSEKVRLSRARGRLLSWFEVHGRILPWRGEAASTYHKICVEVLLQRTRAETVAGIYHPFFERFPSWAAIAATPRSDLERYLKPVGLWQRRAISLQGLAAYAAARNGIFPSAASEHAKIPGVGQYVSNAILLFQHGQRKPLLDVNMARFLERYERPRVLADIRYDPWLQDAAAWLARSSSPKELNWAVLDHAALVCKPRKPYCEKCPLRSSCNWARGRPMDL
ncbi:hypothetical protein [Oceanibium sediminis]|uniref:hypothetical protein n=1 Tax=Oceanibium sediminis TaxID=2026339 RepID=UPI000DD3E3F5|nr:hypothetical protein [Oceanibium sediminis]